jgi:ribosomal protein S18 acetylase RimI-like enzyme
MPALGALFRGLDQMQRDWRVFTPRPDFRDEVCGQYLEAMSGADTIVLLAEEGSEVVGMAHGEVHAPSRFSDERALELSSVVVRAAYRGRGIGRELVKNAARFAQDRGVDRIELRTFAANDEAMRFWRSVGFMPRLVQLTSATGALVERLDREG